MSSSEASDSNLVLEKRLEELATAKNNAEEASKLKDKFISLVAHDLKSPFNAILGYAKLLEKDGDNLTDKQRKMLGKVIQNGEGLVKLIDDLLDISRLQSGDVRLYPIFFDVHNLVSEIIVRNGYLAEQKKIALQNFIPVRTRMYGDRSLIGEVVQNIITNAIKFCSDGDTITVFRKEGIPSAIWVSDTGPGIAPKMAANIFRHDVKTTSQGTAGEVGTGLGLPYSNDIIKLHGGKLEFEQGDPKGAVFSIALPHRKPKLLLVDDDLMMRETLKITLEEFDLDIDEAEDGSEALQKLEKTGYDLVITDLIMPKVDGFRLLTESRKLDLAKKTPVIVITSDKMVETRDRAFELGAADFVVKPFQKEDVLPRVRRQIFR